MLSHSPCFGLQRAKDATCLSDLLFNLPDDLSQRDMLRCRQCNGIWQSWTLEKVKVSVLRLAAWLQSEGISKGDRVGILGHNCVPWLLADMAIYVWGRWRCQLISRMHLRQFNMCFMMLNAH